jgi:DNA-binding response OmpR family regulator
VAIPWGEGTSRPPHEGAGLCVLIGDDHADAADSLALLLRLWGHDVHVAYNARAAVELVGECHPDVVLCELDLPGMDVERLARALRPALLVAVTAWGRQVDRARSQAAGFDYYLVKPADPGEILELLAAVAYRKAQAAPAVLVPGG